MAAANMPSRKSISYQSGMTWVMYRGMILSMLPPATATAILPSSLKNTTLDRAPTTKATPVMVRMKMPPYKHRPVELAVAEDTVM